MTTLAERVPAPTAAEAEGSLPPLVNGDHLDQPTFHARYEAMPPNVRAELIGGIVFMASPVRLPHRRHDLVVAHWLAIYEASSVGVQALSSGTVILGEEDEPEPDATLSLLPEYGGKTRVENDYVTGTPELVVEIAHSTEAIDLNRKKLRYERAGVDEYVVVLLRQKEVRWFVLHEGRYQPMNADDDGLLRSRKFPGLWLDPAAMLGGDLRRIREVAEAGLASPEHAAWIAELKPQT
jgi:Uma2 family endonuclease